MLSLREGFGRQFFLLFVLAGRPVTSGATMRTSLAQTIFPLYRALFARQSLYRLNRFVFSLALRGMGILNYQDDRVSGEDWFLRHFFCRLVAGQTELVVFDVGANEGAYAYKVREIYPDAEVHAFEPHPETFERLQQNGSREGFKAYNVACGKTPGEVRLYDYRKAEGKGTRHASLYEDVIGDIHHGEPVAWDVQVVALDRFIEEREIPVVHLLKVDTEGHDLSVVLGALDSIRRGIVGVIQFEFSGMNVVSRTFLKDFYDVLPGHAFYRMLPSGLVPLGTYDPLTCELFAYQNIVAIPQRYLPNRR